MHDTIPVPASADGGDSGRMTGNYIPKDWNDYLVHYWDYTVRLFLSGGIHPDRVGDAVADFWEYMMKQRDGLAHGRDGKIKPAWDILTAYSATQEFARRDGQGTKTANFRTLHTKLVKLRIMDARDKQAADMKRSSLSFDVLPWSQTDEDNPALVRIMAMHGQVYEEQLLRLRRAEFYRIIGQRLAEVMPETSGDPLDLPLLFEMLMLQDEETKRTNQKELAELAGIPVGQIKLRMAALRELLAPYRDVLWDLLTDDAPLICA